MSTDDRMETITDPAVIRACDEPDERGDFPCCTTPAPSSGAGPDLGALHETICDKFTGMAEVQQAADLLVAEVRRLVKYRDWWKASSLANAEDVRRLAAICHDWRDRSEAAEAEVRRLTEAENDAIRAHDDLEVKLAASMADADRLVTENGLWRERNGSWRTRAESAEAEVVTLRARLAEGRRIVGMLAETVESECENERDICHEHDRTSDGSCALLADLLRARAALATTGEGQ